MTIYRLKADVNNYQFFLPSDLETVEQQVLMMDCERRLDTWKPPRVYIHQPKLKRGNFIAVGMGSPLACDERTLDDDKMYELLEMSGELLPLPHEGETFYIINPLECINALDREQSEWGGTIKIGIPRRYVFHRIRIPETPLFKIPETSRGEILCAENAYDPEYEFKRRYEQLGLTGLRFEKLWSDED